jgi:hypothetical protein
VRGDSSRVCLRCGYKKPIEEFPLRSHAHDRSRSTRCRACTSEMHKHKLWEKRFGMTPQDYEDLLQQQNGVCALCGQPETKRGGMLAVDHDHVTGRVRGLLCTRCNWAIGMMETVMTAEWRRKARRYIEV